MDQDFVDPIEDFHARLHVLTPVTRATTALIAVNVTVYLAMIVRGDNGVSADARGLLAWGANFGPATRAEWWRLLTASFLHGGLLHIALNMLALRSGGRLLERTLGPSRFVAVYLLTAVTASLGSVLAGPLQVSVGASGAIFGVFGALLGVALHHAPPAERWRNLRPSWGAPRITPDEARHLSEYAHATHGTVMPPLLARLLSTQIVALVIVNVLIGLAIPVIDNTAHVVGFAAGLALGWIGAGAVSTRLASAGTDAAVTPSAMADRSGWFVPAATAVSLVLGANAAFPLLPPGARLSILETGCRAGAGSACLAAAHEIRNATGGRITPAVHAWFDRGCAAGSGASCTAAGLAALAAPDGAQLAARALSAACALHDVPGCRGWAAMLEIGRGVTADVPRAMRVYAQACDRDDAFSCLRLAEAILQGRGVAKDPKRALALAVRACGLGEPRGCTVEGVQRAGAKDYARAFRAFDLGCRGGEPIACTELGARYETGDGVGKDVKLAAYAYYENACARGFGVACTRAGRLFERAPEVLDPARAAGSYEQGCTLGQAESCFNLGVMVAEGRGRPRDEQKALANYEQACARGLTQVCGLVDQLKRATPQPTSPAAAIR